MFEKCLKKLEELEPLVDMTAQQDISAMASFLYERIKHHDSYLVFLGETSSGKSSLINGLLGTDILPMKAYPSTAAITEVELSSQTTDDMYYAINKNATIEKIDKSLFLELSEHPDENLKRLKVVKNIGDIKLDNLRIFDTPGYGSIIKEHEEVLKEFLPNSDIVVYTVNYKDGIQDEDYLFLRCLRELIRQDVKIFLLVNRCPIGTDRNSMKVRKIAQFVSDILTIEPEVFTVENIVAIENEGHAIPKCENLWKNVSKVLSAPERVKSLNHAFEEYIKDLYNKSFKVIETKYLAAKLNADEFAAIIKLQQDTAQKIKHAVIEFVDPAFEKIEKNLPTRIHNVRRAVYEKIHHEIEISSRMDKEEMVGYVNAHLLPHSIKKETEEVQNYINIELDDLNRKVDDYLQKEIVRFNNQLSITINTHLDAAVSSMLAGILKNIGINSLEGYFFAFGGGGGANAGIANAASHLLKKTGDLFNHTFSRATHNGVKHFLSKIGATSMKAVGVAVSVVIEFLVTAYDLATWKGKLSNKVEEGLDKWQKETCDIVQEDLKKLKDENVETIIKIADDIAHSYDSEKPNDIEKCHKDYLYAQYIGKVIGIE